MAEQARLDMRQRERLFQQRIVPEIYLPDREVISRPPKSRFRSNSGPSGCDVIFAIAFIVLTFFLWAKAEDANDLVNINFRRCA